LNIADSLNITETVFSFALLFGWFFLGKELFVRGQPTFVLLIAVGAAMVLAADTMRVLLEGQPGPDVLMMIQGIGITGKLMILWSLFRGRHHLLP
jgi:drug/metabolite transporter (DMT)-like permease